jgi:hypothetical protein
MTPEDFRDSIELISQAHNWRPIGELLEAKLYQAIAEIPDEDYLRLTGDFIALPSQTPAHLLQSIKALRGRRLKELESAASPNHKGWRDMSPAERASYQATIARVKAKLSDDLARLYAAGRIPVTRVPGFSSTGSLLANQILKRGLDELLLEAQLEQEPAPAPELEVVT